MLEELEFYAVRNKEGKYFRAKGRDGYGETWVADIKKARIYQKPGPAKAVVSWFFNNYPSFGVPDLIKFTVSKTEIIDESIRINKEKEKKQKKFEKIIQDRKKQEEQRELIELKRLEEKYRRGY